MKRNAFVTTVALTVWIFLAWAPVSGAGTRVTAKGMSFMEPGREMIAREKALDQARRAAVEKVVGATVESLTSLENSEMIKDQILSRSSGYLENIDIVRERKTDMGTYEVTIEADVKSGAMSGDIDRFQALLALQKNPRIRVLIDADTDDALRPAARKAVNLLSAKLADNGFVVLADSASKTALKTGLLVKLLVEHATRSSEYQGLSLTLNEVSLSARIIHPGDQKVLGIANEVKSLPGENRLKVVDKATRECVRKIWGGLSGQLAGVWQEELYGVRDLLLVAKAVPSHEKALLIERILKSDVSGIADARLIAFEKGHAEYALKYRGWPEQFTNELGMSYFRSKYFKSDVKGIGGNTITIRIGSL